MSTFLPGTFPMMFAPEIELYGQDAPSGIMLLIAWLLPLKNMDGADVGPNRDALDTFPFRMVQGPAGSDDKITDHGIYQVDDFCKAATRDEAFVLAEAQSRITRRRILALGPPLSPQRRVTMPDGSVAYADSVTTSQKPIWQPYGDNTTVARFVSRYAIDLRMV